MPPGSLAKNLCFTHLYSTVEHVHIGLPEDVIPIDSLLIILTPPNGTLIKVLYRGKIGWVSTNFLEAIYNETR
jgi:hypothetical protein